MGSATDSIGTEIELLKDRMSRGKKKEYEEAVDQLTMKVKKTRKKLKKSIENAKKTVDTKELVKDLEDYKLNRKKLMDFEKNRFEIDMKNIEKSIETLKIHGGN